MDSTWQIHHPNWLWCISAQFLFVHIRCITSSYNSPTDDTFLLTYTIQMSSESISQCVTELKCAAFFNGFFKKKYACEPRTFRKNFLMELTIFSYLSKLLWFVMLLKYSIEYDVSISMLWSPEEHNHPK